MEKLIDSDLQKEPSEVFEIQCKLGKGSYGSVFKARHKQNGFTVAAKLVPVDSELSDIVKEISIMQQCKSEYIVQYYGSFYDSHDLWIVMEYCGAGSVSDIMRLLGRTCLEPEIAVIVRGALCGLEYIHQLKKIHRDVKAGNILLTEEGCAKLADFGVAGQLSDTLAKRNTVIGTPYWMAPEVIQEVGYTCSADIWSLGVTVIEMAEGRPPHADVHPMRALFMIPSQPAPSLSSTGEGGARQWSEALVALVAACLQKAPDARPTASGLLQGCQFVREAPPASSTLVPAIKAAQELRASSGGGGGTLGSAGEDTTGGGGDTMVRVGTGAGGSDSCCEESLGGSLEAPTMLINTGTSGSGTEDGGDTLTQTEARNLRHQRHHAGSGGGGLGNGGAQGAPAARDPPSGGGCSDSAAEVYRNLESKSYPELEALLNRLDGDLEAELQGLADRYQHKRQPLLDAIQDKALSRTATASAK